MVAVILIATLGLILSSLKTNLLQPSLDNIKTEIDQANTGLSSYEKLEEEALFLNDRAKLAKELESQKAYWSQILQDLINSVPQEVQVTNLTADLSKTPNFVLQGNTNSEREVIKFKEKLDKSDFFKDVAFKSATTDEGTDTTAKTLKFSLEFNLEQKQAKTSTDKEVK
ncbi:hypothetical protein A2V71_01760 [Candidatus Berkelbacteria bacterium RBG_13_40_8]|uniref:Fimbrial assembly protein n=1 Tax=Candidatus Berkelbacteria bacterium RBG_13_40_8 TaxID=1797467 RepID=A0A1F5DQ54_9BACT|nr:MAG: hypothetical protein A2V71_01760 [Candidatus Berkelbacteria bacterium RBG_13_40_8]